MPGSEVVEGDLISRAAAIEYLMTNMGWHDEEGYEVDDADEKRKVITDLVNGITAVDAVPVVRCKDCKYAHMTYDGECKYCDFWQEDGGDALYLDKGFYCAAGERRDGDTE